VIVFFKAGKLDGQQWLVVFCSVAFCRSFLPNTIL
jgi:hypothetical protein